MKVESSYVILDHGPHGHTVQFTIPVEPAKKWWEFCKKDDKTQAQEALHDLMQKYKQEIEFDEVTGVITKRNDEVK